MANAHTKKSKAKKKITKKVAKKAAPKKMSAPKAKATKTNSPAKKQKNIGPELLKVAKALDKFIIGMNQLSNALDEFVNVTGPHLDVAAGAADKFIGNMNQLNTTIENSFGKKGNDTTEITQMDLSDLQTDNGETTYTKEDVKQALQKVMTIVGQDEVRNILTTVKVKRVSDIKEKHYTSVMTMCNNATGPQATTETKATETTENDATSMF